jgi:integrase/recombinase XerD
VWSGLYSLRIQQLKEPQNILPTLTADQVTRLVNWKPMPRHFYQRRLHLLTLLLLDTGCRITEALTLRVRDLDMDNMLITLDGKGAKTENRALFFHTAQSPMLYVGLQPEDRFPAICHVGRNAG